MNAASLVSKAYETFADFPRPNRCLPADLYESEREEFEAMLEGKSRDNLQAIDLGSTTWSPLAQLSPEAFGHFMPRLIEFALSGELDYGGEPFFERLICAALSGPGDARFSLFKDSHRAIVHECLVFLLQDYASQVEELCWSNELRDAITRWDPNLRTPPPNEA